MINKPRLMQIHNNSPYVLEYWLFYGGRNLHLLEFNLAHKRWRVHRHSSRRHTEGWHRIDVPEVRRIFRLWKYAKREHYPEMRKHAKT